MKRLLSNKWFWIAVAVLVVVALVLVFFYAREIFEPLLIAVLIVGVLWILTEVGLRAWKKHKRKGFDEGMTAKEGIEDRKREWEGFQAELDKQKIDRYELPFYLLVGEPQSGKSVLLQNSDLHFPFGQNKLSGIGGTRGCDWWFTEEAVILDLAGRLFTHEGGVADQVEWEAFLDLLTNFRPICPANGILLVVPCDSLLTDSPDAARQKANKIQAALLTLAKKLEAQLPIYLVLTKADKIFGFAESVHRLDAPKRHEMFGWSRAADKVDAAFDMEEARGGFREMVGRARVLRSEMMSSAMIPEALSEIDRMYAFPDELAALEEPLDIYLRRVFTDSGLSDRLSFRGIYLTSGLQAGVPIARVCAEALGGGGDADMQELEALFTKQRAYFIKDLVRSRVFAERGIVRPTKGRVIAAQRRAAVGYGVSAVIALISVIGGIFYLFSNNSSELDTSTKEALDSARNAEKTREWGLKEHLRTLASIQSAIAQPRAASEEIFSSTRTELKKLFVAEFDARLVPSLRKALQARVTEIIDRGEPENFDQVRQIAECATLMLGKSNYATSNTADLAKEVLPQSEREVVKAEEESFTLADAIDLRSGYSSEPALCPPGVDSPALQVLGEKALDLFEDCLTPGKRYQPFNELGFFVNWVGVQNGYLKLNGQGLLDDREILAVTQEYADSLTMMENCEHNMEAKTLVTWEIKGLVVTKQKKALVNVRDPLADLIAERSGIDHAKKEWRQKKEVTDLIETKVADPSRNIDPSELLEAEAAAAKLKSLGIKTLDIQIDVPNEVLATMMNKGLAAVCRSAPNADWTLETLGSGLEVGTRASETGGVPREVYVAKVREVGRRFAERYPNWKQLADELGAAKKPLAENKLAFEQIKQLVQARTALLNLDKERTRDFVLAIDKLLSQHLESLDKTWADLSAPQKSGVLPTFNPDVIDALTSVRGSGFTTTPSAGLDRAARGLSAKYVTAVQDLMLQYWRAMPGDGASTLEMVRSLGDHFGMMKLKFGGPGKDGDDGLDREWLGEVQAVLVSRLEDHERAASKYWTPVALHGQAGMTIGEAARTVVRKLSRDDFQELLDGAAEGVKAPSLDDPLLARKSEVFEKLELASKALEKLRKYKVPSNRGVVLNTPYVEWLKTLADGLSATAAQDGPQLAARVWEIDQSKRGDLNIPDNAGGMYAKGLFDTLRLRMIDEVRARYEADLTKLLEDFSVAIDALYTTDFDPKKAPDETVSMQNLSVLLDKNGRFDTLIKNYHASDDTLGLIPKDPAVLEAKPIWGVQRFLGELQVFLLGKDGRTVSNGTITVALRPLVNESSSIWDPSAKGWKEAFYYPSSVQGDWEYESVDRDMPEKNLVWNFRADKSKRMRMRWNESPNSARNFEPGDVKFELIGSLAPMLFAWSGEKQENGNWRVIATLTGSQLVAPFEVRFLERELPVRPKRP
jgi:hypothetical protein